MVLKSKGPIPIAPGAKLKIAILIKKMTLFQKLFIVFFLRNRFSSKGRVGPRPLAQPTQFVLGQGCVWQNTPLYQSPLFYSLLF